MEFRCHDCYKVPGFNPHSDKDTSLKRVSYNGPVYLEKSWHVTLKASDPSTFLPGKIFSPRKTGPKTQ